MIPLPETDETEPGLSADAALDGATSTDFISDLAVAASSNPFRDLGSALYDAGYEMVKYYSGSRATAFDCNWNARGHYIYLGYKECSDFAANTEDLITGLIICVNCHPNAVVWNDKTYYPVSTGIADTNFDLN